MRSMLLIGFTALALSFSGYNVSAATLGEAVRSVNTESIALAQPGSNLGRREATYVSVQTPTTNVGARDRNQTSFVEAIATVAALAGVGFLLTLAAVGLRWVWTQDPIRDPLGEGPGYL